MTCETSSLKVDFGSFLSEQIPPFEFKAIKGDLVPTVEDGSQLRLNPWQMTSLMSALKPHPEAQGMYGMLIDWQQMCSAHKQSNKSFDASLYKLHADIATSAVWTSTLEELNRIIPTFVPIANAAFSRNVENATNLHYNLKRIVFQGEKPDLYAAGLILRGLEHKQNFQRVIDYFTPKRTVDQLDLVGTIFTTQPGKEFLQHIGLGEFCSNISPTLFSEISKDSTAAKNIIDLHAHIVKIPQEQRERIAHAVQERENWSHLRKIRNGQILTRSPDPTRALLEYMIAADKTNKFPRFSTELFTTAYLDPGDLLPSSNFGEAEDKWKHLFSIPPPYGYGSSRYAQFGKIPYWGGHWTIRDPQHNADWIMPVYDSDRQGMAHRVDLKKDQIANYIVPVELNGGVIHIQNTRYAYHHLTDEVLIRPVVSLGKNGRPVIPEEGGNDPTDNRSYLFGAGLYYLQDGTSNKWREKMFRGGVYRYSGKEKGFEGVVQKLQEGQVPLMIAMQADRDNR